MIKLIIGGIIYFILMMIVIVPTVKCPGDSFIKVAGKSLLMLIEILLICAVVTFVISLIVDGVSEIMVGMI